MLPNDAAIWDHSPFGIAIYLPTFDDEGSLEDLVLLWLNKRIGQLIHQDLQSMLGRRLSELAGSSWLHLRTRYAIAIATGKPFSYARQYEQLDTPFDYSATAWFSHPYVTVLVTQESVGPTPPLSDPHDIESGTRLVEAGAQRTLELVRLLRSVNGDGSSVAEL